MNYIHIKTIVFSVFLAVFIGFVGLYAMPVQGNPDDLKTFAPLKIEDYQIRSFLSKHGVDVAALEDAWGDIVLEKVLTPYSRMHMSLKNKVWQKLRELNAHAAKGAGELERSRLAATANAVRDAMHKRYIEKWLASPALKNFYQHVSTVVQQVGITWQKPASMQQRTDALVLLSASLEAIGFYDHAYTGAKSVFNVGACDSAALARDSLSLFIPEKSDVLVKKVLTLVISYFNPKRLAQRFKAGDTSVLSFPLMRVDMVKTKNGGGWDLILIAYPGARQDVKGNASVEEIEGLQESLEKDYKA